MAEEVAAAKKTRGPNKQTPWARPEGEGAVLRLALDLGDPVQRARLEQMFSAGFALRRALQRDARSRAAAYWAASRERASRGPDAVRERLGLSRNALERAAYGHLDAAPHLRRFATKASVMHLADSVWSAIERNLFRDSAGKRHGMLRIGRWFDFTRLPGRARSHTKERKWETFRLHGTLAGHRAGYSGPGEKFFQPRAMHPVAKPESSWWAHEGALVVVFSGLGDGELVLPVRLPSEPSNQPILDHYLSDPSAWHKVDLVRRRDPNRPGGWRYEAHLMVLVAPYVSPATRARRERAARETAGRSVGIDVNVSNVTLASHLNGKDLRITRIARDAADLEAARKRAKKERKRARKLERSRRASNPDQYELSPRQKVEARRREERGLTPRTVVPSGARKSRTDLKPLRAFRKDTLSKTYRTQRAAQVAEAAAAARRRKDHARAIAGELTLRHGFKAVIEDCNLGAWARLWGRSMAAFSPGTLTSALEREAEAVAKHALMPGGILRASTTVTALSQNCLCGQRTLKTLAERVHRCATCGLVGDRDAMAAVLATVVSFRDAGLPSSAFVDPEPARALDTPHSRKTLEQTLDFAARGRQDAPSESTAPSASGGSSIGETGRTSSVSTMMARRNVGTAPRATPNETGSSRTKSERSRTRTNLPRGGTKNLPPLRDSS